MGNWQENWRKLTFFAFFSLNLFTFLLIFWLIFTPFLIWPKLVTNFWRWLCHWMRNWWKITCGLFIDVYSNFGDQFSIWSFLWSNFLSSSNFLFGISFFFFFLVWLGPISLNQFQFSMSTNSNGLGNGWNWWDFFRKTGWILFCVNHWKLGPSINDCRLSRFHPPTPVDLWPSVSLLPFHFNFDIFFYFDLLRHFLIASIYMNINIDKHR